MTFRRTAVILKCSVKGSMHFTKRSVIFQIRTAYIFQFYVNTMSHYSFQLLSMSGHRPLRFTVFTLVRVLFLFTSFYTMTHLCNYADVKRCLSMHILSLDISHVSLFTFLIAQEILYKLLHFVNCVLVGSFEQFVPPQRGQC